MDDNDVGNNRDYYYVSDAMGGHVVDDPQPGFLRNLRYGLESTFSVWITAETQRDACPSCGYARTGCAGPVCPECGLEVDDQMQIFRVRSKRRRIILAACWAPSILGFWIAAVVIPSQAFALLTVVCAVVVIYLLGAAALVDDPRWIVGKNNLVKARSGKILRTIPLKSIGRVRCGGLTGSVTVSTHRSSMRIGFFGSRADLVAGALRRRLTQD